MFPNNSAFQSKDQGQFPIELPKPKVVKVARNYDLEDLLDTIDDMQALATQGRNIHNLVNEAYTLAQRLR